VTVGDNIKSVTDHSCFAGYSSEEDDDNKLIKTDIGYDCSTNLSYLHYVRGYNISDAKKYTRWWIYDMLEKISNNFDRQLFIIVNIASLIKTKVKDVNTKCSIDDLLNLVDTSEIECDKNFKKYIDV
jgi:hypothetical protein